MQLVAACVVDELQLVLRVRFVTVLEMVDHDSLRRLYERFRGERQMRTLVAEHELAVAIKALQRMLPVSERAGAVIERLKWIAQRLEIDWMEARRCTLVYH